MTLCPRCNTIYDGAGGRGCPNCGRGQRKDKRGKPKPKKQKRPTVK